MASTTNSVVEIRLIVKLASTTARSDGDDAAETTKVKTCLVDTSNGLSNVLNDVSKSFQHDIQSLSHVVYSNSGIQICISDIDDVNVLKDLDVVVANATATTTTTTPTTPKNKNKNANDSKTKKSSLSTPKKKKKKKKSKPRSVTPPQEKNENKKTATKATCKDDEKKNDSSSSRRQKKKLLSSSSSSSSSTNKKICIHANHKYFVGTKVCKYFEDYGWYYGKIVSFDGEFYKIVYDDGDGEEFASNDQELDDIVQQATIDNDDDEEVPIDSSPKKKKRKTVSSSNNSSSSDKQKKKTSSSDDKPRPESASTTKATKELGITDDEYPQKKISESEARTKRYLARSNTKRRIQLAAGSMTDTSIVDEEGIGGSTERKMISSKETSMTDTSIVQDVEGIIGEENKKTTCAKETSSLLSLDEQQRAEPAWKPFDMEEFIRSNETLSDEQRTELAELPFTMEEFTNFLVAKERVTSSQQNEICDQVAKIVYDRSVEEEASFPITDMSANFCFMMEQTILQARNFGIEQSCGKTLLQPFHKLIAYQVYCYNEKNNQLPPSSSSAVGTLPANVQEAVQETMVLPQEDILLGAEKMDQSMSPATSMLSEEEDEEGPVPTDDLRSVEVVTPMEVMSNDDDGIFV